MWKEEGCGLGVLLSPSGNHEGARSLKITLKRLLCGTEISFIGWFFRCKGRYGSKNEVTWRDISIVGKSVEQFPDDEYLGEMRIMNHGLTAMMNLFGEEQIAIYFRKGSNPCHHLHVHACAIREYKYKKDDSSGG